MLKTEVLALWLHSTGLFSQGIVTFGKSILLNFTADCSSLEQFCHHYISPKDTENYRIYPALFLSCCFTTCSSMYGSRIISLICVASFYSEHPILTEVNYQMEDRFHWWRLSLKQTYIIYRAKERFPKIPSENCQTALCSHLGTASFTWKSSKCVL